MSSQPVARDELLGQWRDDVLLRLNLPDTDRALCGDIENAISSRGHSQVLSAVEDAVKRALKDDVDDVWRLAKGILNASDISIQDIFNLCHELESSLRHRINLAMTATYGPDWYLRPPTYLPPVPALSLMRGSYNLDKVQRGFNENGDALVLTQRTDGSEFLGGLTFGTLRKIARHVAYAGAVESLFLRKDGSPITEDQAESFLDKANQVRNAIAHGTYFPRLAPDQAVRHAFEVQRVIDALNRSGEKQSASRAA